ncbi:MAG TPA: hypothetical protein ENN07_02340 [candidate division Zixibacteria bacterium]|nr:hypothetical protein [candidate division Zixibacteria bacterium]
MEFEHGYEFTNAEVEDGKTMGILAYILFLIPLLAQRENRFAMFHTEQAIVLCIIAIALSIIGNVSIATCIIPIIASIATIGVFVLWIMGLINAIGGKAKFVPIVGQYGPKLGLCKPGGTAGATSAPPPPPPPPPAS